ncbi:MAG TPA: ABC transporter ATP-binding protein [Anaerolineales bacterium]|nr:ABC transporter ATP-binding protein [Anaerolineales bacterium]
MQASLIDQTPRISLRGITKAFTSVLANDHIDLDIYNAEIHALLGENGAGKSTLMKILFGFYRADSGEILLNGKTIPIQSPRDARAARIGMVFQDLNLIPAFSVAENIALFLTDLKAVLNPQEIERRINEISKQYGLQVNPGALISQLSIGEQQKVEILKLLLSDARLLILDEPTRVLAPHEVKALFGILDNLRKDGYAIVLITHKLKEVLECADRITVLRSGCVAGSLLRADATEDKLVKLMFEKELSGLTIKARSKWDGLSAPVLELCGMETQAEGGGTSLKGIDLQIHPGEIVGVAGVSGNGQKELCDVILGTEMSSKGEKYLFGKNLTNHSVQTMRKSGVSFIPENPLLMASVPFMTVLENMALTDTWRYARRGGFSLDWKAVQADAKETIKRLGFSVNLHVIAKSLSGGNLQRMVILREMTHDPRLIIASYLTRGLDVQSAMAARQALIQARESGVGVLLISEDFEELFTLSDRLLVLYSGRFVGEFKPSKTDIYAIGHLMTGSEVEHAAKR